MVCSIYRWRGRDGVDKIEGVRYSWIFSICFNDFKIIVNYLLNFYFVNYLFCKVSFIRIVLSIVFFIFSLKKLRRR